MSKSNHMNHYKTKRVRQYDHDYKWSVSKSKLQYRDYDALSVGLLSFSLFGHRSLTKTEVS